jgi:putative hydrolase of the HAD superfamily
MGKSHYSLGVVASTLSKPRNVIRAVFFDYDGVLTLDATGSLTTHRYISERTRIPFEQVERAFRPHNHALNLGRTTYAEVWPAVCSILGRTIPADLLRGAFESTSVNPKMFALVRQLNIGCATGIITDNKRERIDHLRGYQHLDELFAPIVVSAEVGCTKDHPAIFEYALEQSRVAPEESIFIDNTSENLLVAAALGMNVIHFDDAKNDVAQLTQQLQATYGLPAQWSAS